MRGLEAACVLASSSVTKRPADAVTEVFKRRRTDSDYDIREKLPDGKVKRPDESFPFNSLNRGKHPIKV